MELHNARRLGVSLSKRGRRPAANEIEHTCATTRTRVAVASAAVVALVLVAAAGLSLEMPALGPVSNWLTARGGVGTQLPEMLRNTPPARSDSSPSELLRPDANRSDGCDEPAPAPAQPGRTIRKPSSRCGGGARPYESFRSPPAGRDPSTAVLRPEPAGAGAGAWQLLSNESIAALTGSQLPAQPGQPRAASAPPRALTPCLAKLQAMRRKRSGLVLTAPDRAGAGRNATAAARAAAPTCAVVGSSDVLRLHAMVAPAQLAHEIDGHDVILRVNHAPARGYETTVGARTTYRVVNHVPLEQWLLPRTRRRSEFAEDVCDVRTGDVERECLYREKLAQRLVPLRRYAARDGGSATRHIGRELIALEDACTRAVSRPPLSGGFVAALVAVQGGCQLPVSLYGFYPFCCHARPLREMRYKYYHGDSTRWVCCHAGREKMEEEYSLFEAMAKRGLVRLRGSPPLASVRPQCSAHADARVGVEAAARERDGRAPSQPALSGGYVEHSDSAVRLADIDCPRQSLDGSRCVCRTCAGLAARVCDELGDACAGFEVSAETPTIATLKGAVRGALVPRKRTVVFERRGDAAGAQPVSLASAPGYTLRADASVPQHDFECPRELGTASVAVSRGACVVCAAEAPRACNRTAACAGFVVNKEGVLATLKAGPLRMTKVKGPTAFVKH